MKGGKSNNGPKKHRIIRVLLRVIVVLIVLLISLVLLLNIPGVQTYIAQKFISSIRSKTGTELSVSSVKIRFPNGVELRDIYVQDKNADTLLFLHSIRVDADLFKLFSNTIAVRKLEIENLVANISRKDSGGDFNFQFILDAISPPSADTVRTSAPWTIQAHDVLLKNVRFAYSDKTVGMDLKVNLGNLESTLKDPDLSGSRIHAGKLFVRNTSVKIVTAQQPGQDIPDKGKADERNKVSVMRISDLFPDLDIAVNNFSMDSINFQYDDIAFPELAGGFDVRHMKVKDFSTGITGFQMSPKGLSADLNRMSFTEGCGFFLKNLGARIRLDEKFAGLENFKFESSRSKMECDASLSYSAFNDLFERPGDCMANIDLSEAEVNADEAFLIVHALADNELATKFRNSYVSVTAKANGKVNDLNIDNLQLSVLEKTILKAHGKVSGLPDVAGLRFDADVDLFSSVLPDVYRFVDPNSMSGLKLPESFDVTGSFKGDGNSFIANAKLHSPFGLITANTFFEKRDVSDTVMIDFRAGNILAGSILADTIYGNINFSGQAFLTRKADSLYYGSAKLIIDDAVYNNYKYRDLSVDALLKGDVFSAEIRSKDTNLTFDMSADINFHEAIKKYRVSLNIPEMDLYALHFTQSNIAFSTDLNAEIEHGGLNNSNLNLLFTNTTFFNSKREIPVRTIDLKGVSSPQGINLAINSDVLDGNIQSNIVADSLINTFKAAFGKYFGDETKNLPSGKNLSFRFNVHDSVDIISLLDSNVTGLKINKLEGNYTSDSNDLKAEIQVQALNYSGIVTDTLDIVADGKNEKLRVDINCDKISYGNIYVDRLGVRGESDRGKILSEISIRDSTEAIRYLFFNRLELRKDLFRLSFLPDGLILDGKAWKVDPDNYFEHRNESKDKGGKVFSARNFVFTNESRSIGIESEEEEQAIRFENFALQDLLGIVSYNRESDSSRRVENLLRGNLNGEIVFPFFPSAENIHLLLTINDLHILDSLTGDLSLSANAHDNQLDIDAGLINGVNKLSLKGTVQQFLKSPVLNLNANVNIENIGRFEPFAFGQLSEMSGKVNGSVNITGTTEEPGINGAIEFDETAFRVNSLNFYAKLNHEKVLFNNKGLSFKNFEIEDAQKKKLIIDGDIFTNRFKKLEFDLKLITEKFQPINSTEADNPVFYGKLSMGANVKLKGDLKNPVIDANILIDSLTNLTYALPGSELKLVTSEGIVEFRDSTQAVDSSLLAGSAEYVTDSIMTRIKGLNLKAHIELDPGVQFTIDVDPKSGDYLTVKGGAKLDILSNGMDNQSVNGVYEVSSGVYQLSFYDLVKKDFTIKPGSTIAWSGRPMNGDMNITAEYVVRTTSVALVANEAPNMSEEEKKIFNRRLPYEIKLNIRGLLSKPEISFNISLPSQYLSDYPLIESRLRQLNMPDMTSQLNKQVFGLLVAGSFIADSPMDNTGGSSSNIASTAARNSVNGILAGQLNNMSGKYITGVDVNFGLTSYEDYTTGSGDVRTEMDIQVSKKLFNDRVTVEAENSFDIGGTKKTPSSSTSAQGYGQFAVIYNLTETGEYKLRAYYQNAYDPYDGDISYSGMAVIFEKELDRLWGGSKPAAGQTNEIDR